MDTNPDSAYCIICSYSHLYLLKINYTDILANNDRRTDLSEDYVMDTYPLDMQGSRAVSTVYF